MLDMAKSLQGDHSGWTREAGTGGDGTRDEHRRIVQATKAGGGGPDSKMERQTQFKPRLCWCQLEPGKLFSKLPGFPHL